jgi:hypothetical protein
MELLKFEERIVLNHSSLRYWRDWFSRKTEVVDFLKWDSLLKSKGQLDFKANILGKWNPEDSVWRWEDWKAEQGKAVPLGRIGKAEEFASMALLLASEQGGFISGTAINVDGGKSPVV